LNDFEERLRALMLKGLSGDRASHHALLTQLSHVLRPFFARRIGRDHADLEDILQDTLIAIHERRMSYDTSQKFLPWAFAIARYKMIDHLRRRRIRMTEPLEDDIVADPFNASEASDAARDLGALTRQLPTTQRHALYDVKVEGLSVAEAASRRGVSESLIKVSVHRALKRLTARVSKGSGDAD
jgi:RNA polymerase sigma-70 factor (ECF subfamily)